MSQSHNKDTAPSRPLRADFTAYTLRHAVVAKRRAQRKHFNKELFTMKSLSFLRTAPGAALALAVVASSSVGVYALTNWFGGNVAVKQDSSVFSVDLSGCKGNLPPGITSADRHAVQFKILGNPHIAAADLQSRLLAQCEFDAVSVFYSKQPATVGNALTSGVVTAVDRNAITLRYQFGGETHKQSFQLADGGAVFDKGQQASLGSFHAGDTVVIATQPSATPQENVNPLDQIQEVQGVFKTQYDTQNAASAAKENALYGGSNNIMPLDWYNQTH